MSDREPATPADLVDSSSFAEGRGGSLPYRIPDMVFSPDELRGEGILVNAATPGFVATDLNDRTGGGTVEQGASVVVGAATLGDDGPTGTFFGESGAVPW